MHTRTGFCWYHIVKRAASRGLIRSSVFVPQLRGYRPMRWRTSDSSPFPETSIYKAEEIRCYLGRITVSKHFHVLPLAWPSLSGHSAEYGDFMAVSMVAGLRFSLSTAYTLGDMGKRSEGDCGSAKSLRIVEMGINTEGT